MRSAIVSRFITYTAVLIGPFATVAASTGLGIAAGIVLGYLALLFLPQITWRQFGS
jgi:hypothetical protein